MKYLLRILGRGMNIVFCGCTSVNSNAISTVEFEKKWQLTGTPLPAEVVSLPPSQLELIDSSLILMGSGEGIAGKILNMSGGQTGVLARICRGPGEFLNPWFSNYSPSTRIISIYDIPAKKLKQLRWNPVDTGQRIDYISEKEYSGHPVWGSTLTNR